ncbi:hypothetical protein C0Q70_13614 [Pomacea canaliculata]|uniref:MARVEL domain-containing protein n=2 Tax=Pomacea canaliculata TaxID=400727 RepID=A0A2T7NXP5_POMCA|nr:hypothetical protein C0Q70_13614 [Pomacea canaliculata]
MFCAWISFCLPTWGYNNDSRSSGVMGYGLWRECGKGALSSGCSDISGTNLDWYGVVQAMASLGFIGVNLALVLVVLQIFVDKCKGAREIAFWNFVQCVITAVCYLIAVIIFGSKYRSALRSNISDRPEFGYAFGLAVVALAINGIAVAVLQFMEGRSAAKS